MIRPALVKIREIHQICVLRQELPTGQADEAPRLVLNSDLLRTTLGDQLPHLDEGFDRGCPGHGAK